MKQLIFATLLLSVTAFAASDYDAMFQSFKVAHRKSYISEAEESKGFKIFVENMRQAAVLQASNPLATFGANKFSDLTETEFKAFHNAESHFKYAAQKPRKEVISTFAERKAAAGQKIDWRAKGAVTAVKNQGQCGSCWSFSATGNIEGQWFLAGHTLTSVSEQELVSCDTTDSGCNGGLMDSAFEWLIQNRGGSIVTEASLPYSSGWGVAPACPADLNSLPVGATISSYNDVQKTEDAMAAYCFAHGPVAIALDATSFQSYTSGILTNCISQQIDHGVLIVGFDDTNVPPYWIIKNSWGVDWGEVGYIRVAKGSNQCLITEYPTSSIVTKKAEKVAIVAAAATTTTFTNYTIRMFKDMFCWGNSSAPVTLPLNTCISDPSTISSTFANASTTAITVTQYTSTNCAGTGAGTSWISITSPLNICTPSGPEAYILYQCA